MITNAFSVDVEDYFQVSAMAPYISRSDWETTACRVERNVDLLLDLFSQNDVKATFFILGWVAERYPKLVIRIHASGHEVASHGFAHFRATEQTATEFLADIKRAKLLLEDISGSVVRGFRAPSFSIGLSNQWAFDSILEAGYRYSSSIYPVRHDHYGSPDAPRFPYFSREGLLEIPITTARIFGRNFPAGGGGYFRLLPYVASHWAIKRLNEIERRPAIFYMHPWEIDPNQPRISAANLKTKFRHYLNLGIMEAKLRRLTHDFKWDRIDNVFRKDLP